MHRYTWLARRLAVGTAVLMIVVVPLDAQVKRSPPRPSSATGLKTVSANLTCPSLLGIGVSTGRSFCDVLTGRDPAGGILIKLPPHRGTVTLLFDLHNRHTYSEEQVRTNQAYTRYTATIGVLTMDNTLIERAVVQSEFRTVSDLRDRISGGAAPGGVKAVAPTGTEPISITIPQGIDSVSILGEKLAIERLDGSPTYSAPGRPIAVISNTRIQYRPVPRSRTRR